MESDEALARAAASDEAARSELFARARSQALGAVRRMLANGPARGAVEDVVQDAMERVIGALPTFRGERPGSFAAWVRVIARNAALDEMVRSREVVPPVPPGGHDSERGAVERLDLARAIARLPDQQRAVLLLRAEGLSYREIADALGIAPGTVGPTLLKARLHLLESLEREDG